MNPSADSIIHLPVEAISAALSPAATVHDHLATGGQGSVYRGTVQGQAAAIKVYFPGDLEQRIERETRALAALSCRAIVRLLWQGTAALAGQPCHVVATELIEGRPLDDLLRDGPVTPDVLERIAADISEGIEHLWAERIVHRDLKPSNIIVQPSGEARVIDLGVARHLDLSTLTAVGRTWGTWGYMSPEQTKCARQLTCKSDLYSLGVVLLEAALGQHPTGRDQRALLAADYHQVLPAAAARWRGARLLRRLLHPRPTSRPLPSDVIAEIQALGSQPRDI